MEQPHQFTEADLMLDSILSQDQEHLLNLSSELSEFNIPDLSWLATLPEPVMPVSSSSQVSSHVQ